MIDEFAGIVGIDPGPFSLRSLQNMADARLRHDWGRTSFVSAYIASCAFGAKKGVSPAKINPYKGIGMAAAAAEGISVEAMNAAFGLE